MDNVIKSWIGSTEKSVVEKWGEPTGIDSSNFGQIYIWNEIYNVDNARDVKTLGNSRRQDNLEVVSLNRWCERQLYVVNGVIRNGKYAGNSCPATNSEAKKWFK